MGNSLESYFVIPFVGGNNRYDNSNNNNQPLLWKKERKKERKKVSKKIEIFKYLFTKIWFFQDFF